MGRYVGLPNVEFLSLLIGRGSKGNLEPLFLNRRIPNLPEDQIALLKGVPPAEPDNIVEILPSEITHGGGPTADASQVEQKVVDDGSGLGGDTVEVEPPSVSVSATASREGGDPRGPGQTRPSGRDRPPGASGGEGETAGASDIDRVRQPHETAGSDPHRPSRAPDASQPPHPHKSALSTALNSLRVRVAPKPEGEPSDKSHGEPKDDTRAREVVCSFEEQRGWTPEGTPGPNPGFDIRSTDPRTGTVRLIEVKGLKGIWQNDATVTMTSRQFDDARSSQLVHDGEYLAVCRRRAGWSTAEGESFPESRQAGASVCAPGARLGLDCGQRLRDA